MTNLDESSSDSDDNKGLLELCFRSSSLKDRERSKTVKPKTRAQVPVKPAFPALSSSHSAPPRSTANLLEQESNPKSSKNSSNSNSHNPNNQIGRASCRERV